jgi:hypothetical protein
VASIYKDFAEAGGLIVRQSKTSRPNRWSRSSAGWPRASDQ